MLYLRSSIQRTSYNASYYPSLKKAAAMTWPRTECLKALTQQIIGSSKTRNPKSCKVQQKTLWMARWHHRHRLLDMCNVFWPSSQGKMYSARHSIEWEWILPRVTQWREHSTKNRISQANFVKWQPCSHQRLCRYYVENTYSRKERGRQTEKENNVDRKEAKNWKPKNKKMTGFGRWLEKSDISKVLLIPLPVDGSNEGPKQTFYNSENGLLLDAQRIRTRELAQNWYRTMWNAGGGTTRKRGETDCVQIIGVRATTAAKETIYLWQRPTITECKRQIWWISNSSASYIVMWIHACLCDISKHQPLTQRKGRWRHQILIFCPHSRHVFDDIFYSPFHILKKNVSCMHRK